MQIDMMKLQVDARLIQWAHELRGGLENLGYPTIEPYHPQKSRGSPKTAMSDDAFMTELVMQEVRKEAPESATVLEACYRGYGRWAIERKELAEAWLGKRLSRWRFYALKKDGFDRVMWFFLKLWRMG